MDNVRTDRINLDQQVLTGLEGLSGLRRCSRFDGVLRSLRSLSLSDDDLVGW